ncbi:MAG: carboxypeptidase regulatory-like domain-containing protein [bacterium]
MKNKLYVYSLLIFLMGIFIAISSCKQKEDPTPDPDPTPGAHGVIVGSLTNGVTFQPIANGLVLLVNGSGSVLQSVTASASGTYTMNNISDGNYQVKVQATGFKEMVADSVIIGTKNPKGNFVGLCPVETSFDKPVSALSGLILDKNNLAIANATVSIAADPESLTNGYFSSVLTDSKGQFIIPAIPLVVGKATIPAFKLRVMKDNYQISYSKGIVLTENRMKVRNFSLPPASGGGTVLFEETFETATSWIYTGFWHRQQNATISNAAYPKYVLLAANDNSGGVIPGAYAGSYDAWFGEAATGSFMGPQSDYDTDLSGGTSQDSHEGTLTSPPFTVTSSSGSASLTFWSWYEVESVNPNSSGYDIMEVMVLGNPDSTQVTSLGRLNPYSDPILDNRDAIPYTSGGFNIAPVWKFEQFDLTPFIGQSVRLRFEFRTIDHLYNGFRGWFIDNIKVTTDPVKSSGIPYPVYPPTKPRK